MQTVCAMTCEFACLDYKTSRAVLLLACWKWHHKHELLQGRRSTSNYRERESLLGAIRLVTQQLSAVDK